MAADLAHRETGGCTCPARRSAAMLKGVGFADDGAAGMHPQGPGLGKLVDLPLHRRRGELEPGAATGRPHTIASSPSYQDLDCRRGML